MVEVVADPVGPLGPRLIPEMLLTSAEVGFEQFLGGQDKGAVVQQDNPMVLLLLELKTRRN